MTMEKFDLGMFGGYAEKARHSFYFEFKLLPKPKQRQMEYLLVLEDQPGSPSYFFFGKAVSITEGFFDEITSAIGWEGTGEGAIIIQFFVYKLDGKLYAKMGARDTEITEELLDKLLRASNKRP